MSQVTDCYDKGCPLCRREIALMRWLDHADLLARFHAQEKGRMLSGAAAFAATWRAIPLREMVARRLEA